MLHLLEDVTSLLSIKLASKFVFLGQGRGSGCLLIFEEPEAGQAYGAAIDTLEQVGKVVNSSYAKVTSLA
ncbi:hypothetical protein ACG7TL_003269 [Trametes sanguinea]